MLSYRTFKSVAELDKAYSEHRESLKTSGLPYDDGSLLGAWAEAVKDLETELAKPRDFSSL